MRMDSLRRRATALAAMALCVALTASAQPRNKITPPVIDGHTVGDDYYLANYTQLVEYWKKLATESDRIKLVEIGKTAEGRLMLQAIITAPANFKKLERYKEISVRLARAEALTDEQARALSREGKSVVWIDGGLHANEVINAQALFIEAYELLSRNDAETLRLLNDVILLLVPANPDGMELVSNWYMREADPKKRSMNIPRLYQRYIGHDNNRDSYIANQPETAAINRQLYIEWIPQIMYNQHQTGPAGTVLFFAPFRDPFNYNEDPLVPIGIDLVSAAVHQRFLAEAKPGAVMRAAAPYSTWYNGGERTATGFHNQIGLLSEIIGSPTPTAIPLIASKLLPDGNQPAPIGPQKEWHQRQSIDYVLTADYAILDVASRFREEFLYRIYRAGKNSIERGNKDYWTLTPKRVAEVEAAYAKEHGNARANADDDETYGRSVSLPAKYWDALHTPDARDPRGYIVPSNQRDWPTATKFVNALIKCGVDVHRATKEFTVAGKTYPAGSYIVKTAQAFRPHVRDMFEPQDHPNDLQYPGGPPKPPYDITGYTLAYQFGIEFDRVLDGFDGPFEKIEGLLKTPSAPFSAAPAAAGYLLSHAYNDAYTATAKLLAAGERVVWLKRAVQANGKTYPAGTIYIPAQKTTAAQLAKLANELGLQFDALTAKPQGEALALKPVRVALWDRYGGSMDSGHIRWLFEQAFPTSFELVFAPALDAGNLKSKFDVLVLPSGAVPGLEPGRGGRFGANAANVPEEFRNRVGAITAEKTIPQLRAFVEDGGTIVAIGSSVTIGYHFGLPVANALVDAATNKRLGMEKFYVPGSVLRAGVDNTRAVAYGFDTQVDVMFATSPALKLAPDAALRGTLAVAWYGNGELLRSGWAWGQQYLNNTVAVVESDLGKGKVYLFAPEITFRGQPHGTFKFLFNAIQLAGATPVTLE